MISARPFFEISGTERRSPAGPPGSEQTAARSSAGSKRLPENPSGSAYESVSPIRRGNPVKLAHLTSAGIDDRLDYGDGSAHVADAHVLARSRMPITLAIP
ncbi:MAG TPA: hypothetical protein VHW09_18465 [Bryobacteraceae bacterium]|jgi:hypothetical protein|nr:hypothetical protein [Bryobacteraceae bacterium]